MATEKERMMTETTRKQLLLSLWEAVTAQTPEVTSGVGGDGARVYFSLSPSGESGVLLRINALGCSQEEAEGWKYALGEVFAEAVMLVSELMTKAGVDFQTDEGDVTRIAARRGRYVSSTAFGEAVWMRAGTPEAPQGIRESSQEEILLHTDDLPRFLAVLEKAAVR